MREGLEEGLMIFFFFLLRERCVLFSDVHLEERLVDVEVFLVDVVTGVRETRRVVVPTDVA